MTISAPRERPGLLPRFTLKDNDTFLLADALGDIQNAEEFAAHGSVQGCVPQDVERSFSSCVRSGRRSSR